MNGTAHRENEAVESASRLAVANIHGRRWGLGTVLHGCVHRSIRVYCLSLRYGTCHENIISAER
jgi:hypothetical protein